MGEKSGGGGGGGGGVVLNVSFIRFLSKSVYLIGCQGGKKGSIFVKMFNKISF